MRIGGVLVEFIDLDEDDPFDGDLLSEEEAARRDRFRRPDDARRYVRGRAVVRRRLGAALDTDPRDVPIHEGPQGKPEVDGVAFNLGHAGQWAVLAITETGRVGVDIEDTSTVLDILGVARRVFSEDELAKWDLLEGVDRREAFFDWWTVKEAVLKAVGTGFLTEPSTFTVVRGDTLELATSPDGSDPTAWRLHRLAAPHGFAAALAIAPD